MGKKIRIGNDIKVSWTLTDSEGEAYDLTGKSFSIELGVDWSRITIPSSEIEVEDGNTVSFTFYGRDQHSIGPYSIKFVENDGNEQMVTYDEKEAFVLVPHSWLAGDSSQSSALSVEYVSVSSAVVTREIQWRSGASGDRPSSPNTGQIYFDTTLGKCIVYNGTAWVNMDGTALT